MIRARPHRSQSTLHTHTHTLHTQLSAHPNYQPISLLHCARASLVWPSPPATLSCYSTQYAAHRHPDPRKSQPDRRLGRVLRRPPRAVDSHALLTATRRWHIAIRFHVIGPRWKGTSTPVRASRMPCLRKQDPSSPHHPAAARSLTATQSRSCKIPHRHTIPQLHDPSSPHNPAAARSLTATPSRSCKIPHRHTIPQLHDPSPPHNPAAAPFHSTTIPQHHQPSWPHATHLRGLH